jgi:hypothetical protein
MIKIPAFSGVALFCLVCLCASSANGQDTTSLSSSTSPFPTKVLTEIQRRSTQIDQSLQSTTAKYIQSLSQQDSRICQQLSNVDSGAASRLISNGPTTYGSWLAKLSGGSKIMTSSGAGMTPTQGSAMTTGAPIALSGAYMARIDSLQILLNFLNKNPQLLQNARQLTQLQNATASFTQLQSRLQIADQFKQWLQTRQGQLSQAMGSVGKVAGLQNSLNRYSQQAFYYSQQVRQFKEILNDPDKLLQMSLTVLNRIPAFQRFAKQQGMLGGMFGPPANYGSPVAIAGLQTKSQVSDQIQHQVASGGAGGNAALQNNLQVADAQLDNFKGKLSQLGAGNGDIQVPAGFQPNPNKTKTFWKRLQFGVNFQTTHTDYYYPTVSDLGVSLGYKLGGSNLISVGASYKIGWGNGIQHVAFSSQGVGLRSSLQVKIKGTFSLTGGFEYNYTTPFTSYQQLRQLEYWSKSGLLGLTKTVSLKNRFFKSTTLSLLWDFLSYQQVPRTQPFVFRIGYVF